MCYDEGMSGNEPPPEPEQNQRNWFAALDLRRIVWLVAGIALGALLMGQVIGTPLDEVWPFYSILFVGLVGAFFVFSWADHYARRQIEGRFRRRVFFSAVQMVYVLSVFLFMTVLLDL